MRVVIDWERCDDNGVCMAIAPDVFDFDGDGHLKVLQEDPPASIRDLLEQAVRSCPMQAITLAT